MLSPYAQNAFEGQLRRTGIVRPPNTDIPNGPVDRNTTGPIGAMPINPERYPTPPGPYPMPENLPPMWEPQAQGLGFPHRMSQPDPWNPGPSGPGFMPQNQDNMPTGDPRFPQRPFLPSPYHRPNPSPYTPGNGQHQGSPYGGGNMYGRFRAENGPGPLSAWQWGD